MFDLDKPRPKTVISLTPLIDVVFILLLFFMLATNFETEHAFDVSAAAAASRSGSTNDLPGKLHRLNDMRLSLDGVVLDEDEVSQALRDRYSKDQSYAVVVSVAKGISVQSLFELIAFARQAGIQSVTIASRAQAETQ